MPASVAKTAQAASLWDMSAAEDRSWKPLDADKQHKAERYRCAWRFFEGSSSRLYLPACFCFMLLTCLSATSLSHQVPSHSIHSFPASFEGKASAIVAMLGYDACRLDMSCGQYSAGDRYYGGPLPCRSSCWLSQRCCGRDGARGILAREQNTTAMTAMMRCAERWRPP